MDSQLNEINKEYIAMVDGYFRDNSKVVFGNMSPVHAKYVTKKLFDKAQYEIDVFSGTYCEVFYGNSEIKEALNNAVARLKDKENGLIRVMTIDEDDPIRLSKDFAETNKISGGGKAVIKYLALSPKIPQGKIGTLQHFVVSDRISYRLEDSHEVIRGAVPNVKAKVCANGKDMALSLACYFDTIWNHFSKEK